MDAKPQKPLHPLRVFNDENHEQYSRGLNLLKHHRHQSSPNLAVLAANAVIKPGVKRAAFGDVSNVHVVANRTVKDDFALLKQKSMVVDTKNTLKKINGFDKENVVPLPLIKEGKEKGTAFLRPAQRPLKEVPNMKIVSAPISDVKVPAEALKPVTQLGHDVKPMQQQKIICEQIPYKSELPAEDVPISKSVSSDHPTKTEPGSVQSQEQHDVRTAQSKIETHDAPQVNKSEITPLINLDVSTTSSQPSTATISDYVEAPERPQETLLEAIRSVSISAPAAGTDPKVTSGPAQMVHSDRSLGMPLLAIDTADEKVQREGILIPELAHAAAHPQALEAERPEEFDVYGHTAGEEDWPEDEEEENFDEEGFVTCPSTHHIEQFTSNMTGPLVMPGMDIESRIEIAEAARVVLSVRDPLEVADEFADPNMVAEYDTEIFSYYRELEHKMMPNPHYMDFQSEIQWSMRTILMDWIVQVHQRFNLYPETLFLAVNYIDRFLSAKVVSLNKLQLVGVTALFVAAKYEEINCPSVGEIVYMVDNGYTADEVLKAERFMLSMLKFEMGWPGPMSFLRRISKADDYDLETRTVSKYLLDVTVMDEKFIALPPSYIAAGAHCLSRQLLDKGDWSQAHVYWSGYTYNQLYPFMTYLLQCLRQATKHHQAVFEKHNDPHRSRGASRWVRTALRYGFTLQERKYSSADMYSLPSHMTYRTGGAYNPQLFCW